MELKLAVMAAAVGVELGWGVGLVPAGGVGEAPGAGVALVPGAGVALVPGAGEAVLPGDGVTLAADGVAVGLTTNGGGGADEVPLQAERAISDAEIARLPRSLTFKRWLPAATLERRRSLIVSATNT